MSAEAFFPNLHILLHLLVPGLVAYAFFRDQWKKVWLILCLTMVVDLDHLLATPIYQPGRCSIGFHPLHTAPAIAVYFVMTLIPKTRVVGLGLVIHMALDLLDCFTMRYFGY